MQYQPDHTVLRDKIILVTGAGDGIGKEAALTYARYGATLILLGRTLSKLEDVQNEIITSGGQQPMLYPLDLLTASENDYQEFADTIVKRFPHLDGVLQNAGLLGVVEPIINQPSTLWHDVMQVNVNATFMLTKALIPLMLKAPHASLILTTSSAGRQGRYGWGAYSVSKFATEGLMQVLHEEYKDSSLRINCINPGGTRTSMRASAFPDENAQKLKTPKDLMPLYLYLMSDDSIEVSGQSLDAQPDRKAGPAE
ncbi:TPA: YciK family oxidoreductase [Proteus mirabilis]|nr:YciK family oxidoreductase [Proteus mirabilis]HEJ9452255.1 YciK family oxidoreductase [Proteus mirabilis]HEJ9463884.1 YciK family oxidoreductase [Proteus mirabilis]HEJ9566301.1 YciK family oxidoreductase [Proteus mirabilis]HEJ9623152.1 YciK family oxidoreductase [Proteus mirabilis]